MCYKSSTAIEVLLCHWNLPLLNNAFGNDYFLQLLFNAKQQTKQNNPPPKKQNPQTNKQTATKKQKQKKPTQNVKHGQVEFLKSLLFMILLSEGQIIFHSL